MIRHRGDSSLLCSKMLLTSNSPARHLQVWLQICRQNGHWNWHVDVSCKAKMLRIEASSWCVPHTNAFNIPPLHLCNGIWVVGELDDTLICNTNRVLLRSCVWVQVNVSELLFESRKSLRIRVWASWIENCSSVSWVMRVSKSCERCSRDREARTNRIPSSTNVNVVLYLTSRNNLLPDL